MTLPEAKAPRPALETALDQAMEENRLDDVYRGAVEALLDKPKTHWPSCCLSYCDPCNMTLQRVATRVLKLLEGSQES